MVIPTATCGDFQQVRPGPVSDTPISRDLGIATLQSPLRLAQMANLL